jgi:rod shape-determining protein MreC
MRRFNFVALMVFLAALVWVFTWENATTLAIKSKVMSIFSPFIRTGASVQETIENVAEKRKSPSELAEANTRLLRQVEELKIYREEYDTLKRENDDLRRMLDFSRGHPLRLVPARLLTRNSATWWNTATIDRGLQDGLASELPVRTDEGLVGKVVQVSSRESEVLFITDETCKVAVKIEGSPDQGILSGIRGVSGRTPDLRIAFLPREASIPVGAKVYTSGKGGVFPPGILLGTVTRFTVRDDGGEALVKPTVDFDKIKYVFVVEREPDESETKTSEVRSVR